MNVIMFTKITKPSNLSTMILVNKTQLFLKAPYFDKKKINTAINEKSVN